MWNTNPALLLIEFPHVYTGLLDSITSTANSADCPGVCVHAFATLICYEVLEHVQCPTSMRCCIEAPINGTGTPDNILEDNSPAPTVATTIKTTTTTAATAPPTTTMLTTAPPSTTLKVVAVCLVHYNLSFFSNIKKFSLLHLEQR